MKRENGRMVKSGADPGVPLYYHYDGDSIVDYYSQAGVLQYYFINGPGTDETLFQGGGSSNWNFLTDGLGSNTSASTTTGTLQYTFTYDSFGRTLQSTPIRPRYTGQVRDWESDITYYKARYYDPTLGRFLSEDPIGFAGGKNFYAYVLNNPMNFVDWNGLSPQDVKKLQDLFDSTVADMTKDGFRSSAAPVGIANNVLSTINLASGGRLSKPYLGCAEQTKVIGDAFDAARSRLKLDANWNFQTETTTLGAHTRGRFISSDPKDPEIIADPLYGKFIEQPRGEKVKTWFWCFAIAALSLLVVWVKGALSLDMNTAIRYAAGAILGGGLAGYGFGVITARRISASARKQKMLWWVVSCCVVGAMVLGLYGAVGGAIFGSIPATILYFRAGRSEKDAVSQL